jgi:6-pyruvoyltetrahydropterin/6-carboxytetrahydropterin synthase
MVCDARELGVIIRKHICDVLDHTNLNMDKNFIPLKTQPSTENLVYYIWMELVHLIPNGGKLHCVKLFETNKIYAEYYGE